MRQRTIKGNCLDSKTEHLDSVKAVPKRYQKSVDLFEKLTEEVSGQDRVAGNAEQRIVTTILDM